MKIKRSDSSRSFSVLLLALLLLIPARGWAEPVGQQEPVTAIALPEPLRPTGDSFFYQQLGRPDPFMPFLDIRDEDEEALEGLRRFEPDQLTLTAIVRRGAQYLAMVEDTTGQGHIIASGAAIGRHSRVEEITPRSLVIQQKISTLSGEEEYRQLEMVLTTEGEERE